jgi:hypothetical protein
MLQEIAAQARADTERSLLNRQKVHREREEREKQSSRWGAGGMGNWQMHGGRERQYI